MADPRKTLSFEGIDDVYATFKADGTTIVFDATQAHGSAQAGLAVTLSANGGVVALTADGNAVIGKLVLVEPDGFCNVQVGGYTTLPGGNAATLTRGKKFVGALGASSAKGYIREVNTAVAAELGVADGEIIDPADATNVVICLD